jgi:hypothetical protein
MKMFFDHEQLKYTDPMSMKFKDFPIEDEKEKYKKKDNNKLKISEWSGKQVLLPILGKNKTRVLHQPEQFDMDGIT